MTVSAFIVCCNEEGRIARCLESVSWCDEVLVIDSGSTDATLEICRQYDWVRVIEHPWQGYVGQKRFGLAQTRSTWVLNLDADEEVSPPLRDELLRFSKNAPSNVDGAELLRVVWHLNIWWNRGGWHPEYRLRFVRREAASWGGEEPHERAIVRGKTVRLKGELFHYTYTDLDDHVATLNRFSTIGAQTLHRAGKRCSLFSLLFRPIGRFVKFFFVRRGYRHGFRGLLVAVLESFQVFLKYAKLWELESEREHRK